MFTFQDINFSKIADILKDYAVDQDVFQIFISPDKEMIQSITPPNISASNLIEVSKNDLPSLFDGICNKFGIYYDEKTLSYVCYKLCI